MVKRFLPFLPGLVLLLGFTLPVEAQDTLPAEAEALRLRPEVIRMGTFYGGARLTVEGTVRTGSKALLVIRGAETEEILNRKTRVGPIWINRGKVHVSGVPSLFLSFGPAPLDSFLSRKVLDAYKLDEKAIESRMVLAPPEMNRREIRANFMAMKRQQERYAVTLGLPEMGSPSGGRAPFRLSLHWSKKFPPGNYDVCAYECVGGRVTGEKRAVLRVEEVGFPAWMAEAAREKGSLYGALAVVVALLVGFGIDFLVSRLGRRSVAAH